MNTVSGQWMVFVAGWQCFFGATRSSSTARIHRAPPSFPLPRSSSTPSPLLPLPKHFWNLFHSFQQFLHPVLPHKTRNDLVSRALKAPLPHPAQVDPAPPSLHLAQVRHRPGRQSLDSNLFLHATQRLSPSPRGGWRPGTAAAAAALGSCEWQQQSGSHGLHHRLSSASAVACAHTIVREVLLLT